MLGSHTLARQGVLGRCVPARAGRASPRGGSGTPGGRALARGSPDGSTAALASPPAPATEGSWVTADAGGQGLPLPHRVLRLSHSGMES